jgi:putative zinc finger protein
MNGCNQVQTELLTDYIDGRLTGREMQKMDEHLQACQGCMQEWKWLRDVQSAVAGLGPVKEPADLPLRIRVAVSQERARSRRSILLQAGAGFASAVLLLGTIVFLVSVLAKPETAQATSDEPLGNATAPRLLYFSNAQGGNAATAIDGPVVVEVCINDSGEVYDYRIVSGPTDATTRSQVENLLLFSRFAPARFFGQPVRGLAVLSFSGVSVRG